MKKQVLTICIALLLIGSGQAGTVQIGSGTSTGSLYPIYSCYGYNYSQQIYLQSEISTAGGTSGPVTKLRFYYNSGGTTFVNWSNWTVYLGNTTKNTFSGNSDWVPVASMTQVFSGNIPLPVAGTWLEITLSTPFDYTGGNIIVAVDENSAGYSCTASWRAYAAGSNRGILYYNDNTNPDPTSPPNANLGPSSTIAQIQFEMATTLPQLSVVPSSIDFGYISSGNTSPESTYTLSGSYLTPAAGNLTITPPANFEVSLSSGSGFSSSAISVAYSGGVLPETAVYTVFKPTSPDEFYTGSISNAGGGAATVNVAVSGNSACDTIDYLPFTEEFTDAVVPPLCWSEIITNEDFTWKPSTTSVGAADVEYDPDMDPQDEWLISPAFDFTGIENPYLSFKWLMSYYWSVDPYDYYDLNCLISTDGGATWTDTLWTEADKGLFENFVFYVEMIDLSDYAEEPNVKFAWQYIGADGAQAVIDSIVVAFPPTCPAPVNLVSANFAYTGAELTWTDTTGSNWDLYIVTAGSAAPDPSTIPTVDDIDNYLYTYKGGNANTDYDWYVRTDCGLDNMTDVSTWTGPAQFTTLTSPEIIYTPLRNTVLVNDRTLSATISGHDGIPVSGTGLPVCYWKVNDGAYNSAQAVHVSGDQYDFAFGAGVSAGDTVYYYIVAQDESAGPNVLAGPSAGASGYSAFPPSCSTPPANPESYIIVTGLAGTVTVGSSGNYTSLTGNNGLFAAINEGVLTGDLTALVTSNLSETGETALNEWVEEMGSDYTLTIKPNTSVSPVISGSLADNALIRLNGASRVSIDGSNNGSDSRNLTIANTSLTYPTVLLIGSYGTNTITGISLKNCIINNGIRTATTIVVSDATTSGNSGYFENITIQNNAVNNAYIGIYINAVDGEGSDVHIIDNDLNGSSTQRIRNIGLYLQGVNNATISGNNIGNFIKSNDEIDYGIWLASGCSSMDVYNNFIDDIGYNGSNGYGAKGIFVSTGVEDANINIYNNLISRITGDGDDYLSTEYYGYAFNPAAIFMFTFQSGINIYNNSIYLSGNTLNYHSNAISMGVFIGDSTQADIRNNIIVNNLGLSGTTGYGACGIFAEASSSQFSIIDNNNYYVNPSGSGVKVIGKIGEGITAQTLMEWMAANGQDTRSVEGDPLYLGTSDLQLQSTSPAIGNAVILDMVEEDYAGNPRHMFKPTIGAYDYVPLDFYMWTGLVDDDWNTPGNWSPAGVPGVNDDAGVPPDPDGGAVFPKVPVSGGPFHVDELYLGPDATMTIRSGSVLNVNSVNP